MSIYPNLINILMCFCKFYRVKTKKKRHAQFSGYALDIWLSTVI